MHIRIYAQICDMNMTYIVYAYQKLMKILVRILCKISTEGSRIQVTQFVRSDLTFESSHLTI